MSVPRIVFCKDSYYPYLRPHYDDAVAKGIVASAGTLAIEDGRFVCYDADGKPQTTLDGDYVAAGAEFQYLSFKEPLLDCGVPEESVIDGVAFAVPGLDLPRFLNEGIICGQLPPGGRISYKSISYFAQKQQWKNDFFTMDLGTLSYVESCRLEGRGAISIGNLSCISWNQVFELGLNNNHHIDRVSVYDFTNCTDWTEFFQQPFDTGRITIGSDVWIGRGCHLKASGRPLTIGDGAVIASDSNVVKDVPPYAIVGGNPAKFIRWRFPEPIREALQTIRWWDWPLEKIHAARLEMKAPAAFVKKYLPEAK